MTPAIDLLEPRCLLSAVVVDPALQSAGPLHGIMIGVGPDRKAVALAYDGRRGITRFIRYNLDGTLDPTFRVVPPTSYPGLDSGWFEATLDPQGRLIVAYVLTRQRDGRDTVRLARYTLDGLADTTFGRNGQVEVTSPDTRRVLVQNISVNASGQIALMVRNREATNDRTYVARYTPRGPLDTTWGDDGFVQIKKFAIGRLQLRDDGSLFAFSYTGSGRPILALTARGRARTDLGPDGSYAMPAALDRVLHAVLYIDAQDRAYVTIDQRSPKLYPNNGLPGGLVPRSVTRIVPGGWIDPTWGQQGFVSLDTPDGYITGTQAQSMTIDDAGRVYIIADGTLFRMNANGRPDPEWDFDGRASVDSVAKPQLIADGDSIYVATRVWSSFRRYATPGRFAFRADGTLVISASRHNSHVRITQGDGRIHAQIDDAASGRRAYPVSRVREIEVHLSDGNDVFTYDGSVSISVDAREGNDVIDLTKSNAQQAIHTGLGDDTVRGGPALMSIRNIGGRDQLQPGGGVSTIISDATRTRAADGAVEPVASAVITQGMNERDRLILNLGALDDYVETRGGQVFLTDIGGTNRFIIRSTKGASISLGPGRNVVDTFDGDDTINSTTGRDTIRTRGGNDVIIRKDRRPIFDPYGDTIYGGDGNDLLLGAQGNDYLDGGPGNDTLIPDTGTDTLYGGPGHDTASFIDAIDQNEDDNHIESIETIRYIQ